MAQKNDGSCTYATVTIDAINSQLLPTELNETSGLVYWNQHIWTHNDDSDTKLYACKPDSASIYSLYNISGVINKDWEDITEDSQYLYIGDFGNNAGNRTDLKILRILKSSVLNNNPKVDTIEYHYSNQTQFNSSNNNTDFDCEAFIAVGDSLYLFTKQWISQHTTVYVLPNKPGKYAAEPRGSFNVNGLITGATFYSAKNTIVLSGYSNLLQPFVLLLYDFEEKKLFSGNKRKISINLPFHQIEGIATKNGLDYYVSNEKFVQSFVAIDAKLQIIDLKPYLFGHINNTNNIDIENKKRITLFPNPANESVSFLHNGYTKEPYCIIMNSQGITYIIEQIHEGINTIYLSILPAGVYYVLASGYNPTVLIKSN